MTPFLTPARRRGVEILDDPSTSADVRERAMADVARSNALFGGTRSALAAVRRVLPLLPAEARVLDIGTGLADIPAALHREAARASKSVTTIGLDVSDVVLRAGRARLTSAVAGDAVQLPFADDSADLVLC